MFLDIPNGLKIKLWHIGLLNGTRYMNFMVQMSQLSAILSHNYNKLVSYMGMIRQIGFSTAHSNLSLLFDVLYVKDKIVNSCAIGIIIFVVVGKFMVSRTCCGPLPLL